MRSAIALLLISDIIGTLGAAAIALYAFRRRAHERFLLWFGLFSILYAVVLIVRNSAFAWVFDNRSRLDLPLITSSACRRLFPGYCSFRISTDKDGARHFGG